MTSQSSAAVGDIAESHGEKQATGVNASAEREVLVISYLFPPAGAVGVHRTIRFIKHLPEFGWKPIVLTAHRPKVPMLEPRLVQKLPEDLTVYRSESFEALNKGKLLDGTEPDRRRLPRLVEKLAVDFPMDLWRYFAVPDGNLGWNPYAKKLGADIIRRHKIEAIYVTGKPFSSYLIGHALSRKFGIPWIMDLRDLWVLNQRMSPKSWLHAKVESAMERKLVNSASIVVANTPGNLADFRNAYPQCDPSKFVVITNGFDRDDFADPEPLKSEKFTLGYVGNFYVQKETKPTVYQRILGMNQKHIEMLATHSPRYLFLALKELFDEHPEMRSNTIVRIAGPACQKVREHAEEAEILENVETLGWVSHEESMRLIRQSHVACLMLSRGKASEGWIPSKLFPYLASRTPILGMIPPGDAASIIHETNSGLIADPDSVPQIKEALWKLYQSHYVNGEANPSNAEAISAYEGRSLTSNLAEALSRCCNA